MITLLALWEEAWCRSHALLFSPATCILGRNSHHASFTASIRDKKLLRNFWGFENSTNCDRSWNTIRRTVTCKGMSCDLYPSIWTFIHFKNLLLVASYCQHWGLPTEGVFGLHLDLLGIYADIPPVSKKTFTHKHIPGVHLDKDTKNC